MERRGIRIKLSSAFVEVLASTDLESLTSETRGLQSVYLRGHTPGQRTDQRLACRYILGLGQRPCGFSIELLFFGLTTRNGDAKQLQCAVLLTAW